MLQNSVEATFRALNSTSKIPILEPVECSTLAQRRVRAKSILTNQIKVEETH